MADAEAEVQDHGEPQVPEEPIFVQEHEVIDIEGM